jgi:hypothetical protein
METNHWIELSQRFYLQLLHLYPQAYRSTYKTEMFHVFSDQCRETYTQRGRRGMLWLWLRTLVDLSITATHEHFMDPQAQLGLLEARPDAPLPWKGVLLVLIPGLIFFVSQIVQLTSSKDWFFLVFYRAAYFLILPVLLVWFFTRRFPIWGLIPLGLLYGTLGSYNPSYLISKLPFLDLPHSVNFFNAAVNPGAIIPVYVCVVLLCGFIWYYARRGQIPRSAWIWLGLYGLLILFQIGGEGYRFIAWQGQDWSTALNIADSKQYLFQIPLWYLYSSLPFLVLIFISLFFSRKYGGYSFLLLFGYLLPTVIFGRYDTTQHTAIPFYVVSLVVLLYRFVVALFAPVWLVRAASIPKRQRAAAIPVAIAILSEIFLKIIGFLALTNQNGYQFSPLDLALTIWNQLIVAAGLGLAVTLYFSRDQTAISPLALTAST